MPKNGKDKSEFWWAMIAGARPEPVEVTTLAGRRVAYTCGCGDPFFLDEPDSPVELMQDEGAMGRPDTPAEANAKWKSFVASRGGHAWRGPR